MTSIADIPINDARLFLKKNNQEIPISDDQIYSELKDIILSGKIMKYYPDSIIDWIVAHNLILLNKNIDHYKEAEINSLSYEELKDLAFLLKLDYNQFKNKTALENSIINILFYLGKLEKIKRNYFELTPLKEVNIKILAERNLRDIINDLRKDKSIRPLLYEAIPLLLKNNTFGDLGDFVQELAKIKEFKILKRIVELYDVKLLGYLTADEIFDFFENYKSSFELIYKGIPELIKQHNSFSEDYALTMAIKLSDIIFKKVEENRLYVPNINKRKDHEFISQLPEYKLLKRLIQVDDEKNPHHRFDRNNGLYLLILRESRFLNPLYNGFKDYDNDIGLVQAYIELASDDYNWDIILMYPLYDNLLFGQQYLRYFIFLLKAAIVAKNTALIKQLISSWNNQNKLKSIVKSPGIFNNDEKENILMYAKEIKMMIEDAKITFDL